MLLSPSPTAAALLGRTKTLRSPKLFSTVAALAFLALSSSTHPRPPTPTNWTVPPGTATEGAIAGYNFVPLNAWQANKVGKALDVIERIDPDLAAEIGTAIGATGPGNPNPDPEESPAVEIGNIADDEFDQNAQTDDGQVGIDFGDVSNEESLAVTLIHEFDHVRNLVNGIDPRTDPRTIQSDHPGLPLELAKLMAECTHGMIEYNSSQGLCDLDHSDASCDDASAACLALAESDEVAAISFERCNGIQMMKDFQMFSHPAADAALGLASSAQAGHTQADDCSACVRANNPPCKQEEE